MLACNDGSAKRQRLREADGHDVPAPLIAKQMEVVKKGKERHVFVHKAPRCYVVGEGVRSADAPPRRRVLGAASVFVLIVAGLYPIANADTVKEPCSTEKAMCSLLKGFDRVDWVDLFVLSSRTNNGVFDQHKMASLADDDELVRIISSA